MHLYEYDSEIPVSQAEADMTVSSADHVKRNKKVTYISHTTTCNPPVCNAGLYLMGSSGMFSQTRQTSSWATQDIVWLLFWAEENFEVWTDFEVDWRLEGPSESLSALPFSRPVFRSVWRKEISDSGLRL